MGLMLSTLALFLILLATGGFIVFVIKQEKSVYLWSYRILLAGFAVLTLQLAHGYSVLGAAPVLSFKTALSFFAWTILGAYLLLHLKFRLMVLGSFISPLAAFLMIISSTLPAREVVVKPVFKSVWLSMHVLTTVMGDGMFAVAFMAAIMYLIQENQIKRKRFGSLYRRLPSLQTLDSINHYSLLYGFALLTVGMMTGAFFAQVALGSYWRWDPKEVWSLITWLFYAVLLHERLAVGWRGRRAAILSILAFLVLLFTFLGIGLWMSDYHSFRSLGGQPGL
ncbi:MAG: cytochrome c biogenesis protein CcsA [Deltaproteobacteria bacterium]|nr:cytochrome c biogenesis protein CcsA [Deltaproteobacteria bacterium]